MYVVSTFFTQPTTGKYLNGLKCASKIQYSFFLKPSDEIWAFQHWLTIIKHNVLRTTEHIEKT